MLADVVDVARRRTGIPTSPSREWWERVGAAGWTRAALPGRVGRARLLAPLGRRASARRSTTSRRGAAARRPRAAHGRAHHPARHGTPGADRSARPADLRRLGRVVPAVQRAGRGLRPRRPHDPRDARRRPLGDLGPEGVELHGDGAPTTACSSPAPTSTSPKHAGISWFAFPLDQPGVTIRPLRRDHRPRAVQRGVLRRRGRRRRRPHRRREQRVGGHADHADVRARRASAPAGS